MYAQLRRLTAVVLIAIFVNTHGQEFGKADVVWLGVLGDDNVKDCRRFGAAEHCIARR